MANVKITELTALTAADSASTDVLPIVDVSADATKKLAISDLHRSVPDGTLSAPGIAFQSDLNSGFYRSGTDAIALVTNGAARILIDAIGDVTIPNRVGIGTTSPNYALDVAGIIRSKASGGEGGQITFTDTNNTDVFNIDVDNTGSARIFTTATNKDIRFGQLVGTGCNIDFYTGQLDRLRIDSSGNVGIGTSSPAYRLDVQGGTQRILNQGGSSTLEIGIGTTTNQFAYIDLVGDTTYSDYGFRIIRGNTGANATSVMQHRGTGELTIQTQDAASIGFDTNSLRRLHITSDGNVGIGTTNPQAALDIGNEGNLFLTSSDNTVEEKNEISWRIEDGSEGAYISAHRTAVANAPHDLAFGTRNSSGVIAERMQIDSSGNVGIGTTSPTELLTVEGGNVLVEHNLGNNITLSTFVGNVNDSTLRFQKARGGASGPTQVQVGDDLGSIEWNGYDGSSYNLASKIISKASTNTGDFDASLIYVSHNHIFENGTGEVARINSNGYLLFNHTSASFPGIGNTDTGLTIEAPASGATLFISRDAINLYLNRNSDGSVQEFRRSGAAVGSVSVTTSSTAYNTSSDYRLKENVVPLANAADRLNQLQVHRFNFIADPDTTVDGFLAHEAQAVVPECATGTKDEVDDEGNPVYQGIDQSKLVPLLTAALQEAIAKIETLEQRLSDAGIA